MQKPKNAALAKNAVKKIRTHPIQVLNRKYHSTFRYPSSARPTPAVAPTKHCVVDMGIPRKEANATVSDVANSIQKPRDGVIFVILNPTALMMRYPKKMKPRSINKPPKARTQ